MGFTKVPWLVWDCSLLICSIYIVYFITSCLKHVINFLPYSFAGVFLIDCSSNGKVGLARAPPSNCFLWSSIFCIYFLLCVQKLTSVILLLFHTSLLTAGRPRLTKEISHCHADCLSEHWGKCACTDDEVPPWLSGVSVNHCYRAKLHLGWNISACLLLWLLNTGDKILVSLLTVWIQTKSIDFSLDLYYRGLFQLPFGKFPLILTRVGPDLESFLLQQSGYLMSGFLLKCINFITEYSLIEMKLNIKLIIHADLFPTPAWS